MHVFKKISELNLYLSPFRNQHKVVGFVPTMGALHSGHLELIRKCKNDCDLTVCSIFINPLQFNNREDFVNYPVSIAQDISLLENAGCDVLFSPSEKEVYPEENKSVYDFEGLADTMEGKYRPGHFNGVAVVVKRLFDIVQPQKAYFGIKDYQQLQIIKKMVSIHHLAVEIVPCPIVRESDGLAMSSRNRRLTNEERKIAPMIYRIIQQSASKSKEMAPSKLKDWIYKQFNEINQMQLEYYELVDANTLQPVHTWTSGQEVVACVAVYLGSVRLIDNVSFIS